MKRNEVSRGHHPPTPYWLIVRCEGGEVEALTVTPGGGEATLPVFSFGEEAAMYLRFANLDRRWTIRKTGGEELVSKFLGSSAGIGFVALDPLPGSLFRGFTKLVSMSAERFVVHYHHLVARAQPFTT